MRGYHWLNRIKQKFCSFIYDSLVSHAINTHQNTLRRKSLSFLGLIIKRKWCYLSFKVPWQLQWCYGCGGSGQVSSVNVCSHITCGCCDCTLAAESMQQPNLKKHFQSTGRWVISQKSNPEVTQG